MIDTFRQGESGGMPTGTTPRMGGMYGIDYAGLGQALASAGSSQGGQPRGGGYGNFSSRWANLRGSNEGGFMPQPQQQPQQRPMMPPTNQNYRPMQGEMLRPTMGPEAGRQQLMPQQMGQMFQNYNQLQNPGLLPSRPLFY